MSSLQIGRLVIGPPTSVSEPTGDPIASLGGAVVPAQRVAPQFQLQLATWAADGNVDTLVARFTLRRQLRSLLNNSPLKLQAFLFVVWSDDAEQDGWYVPDQGPLTDMTSPVGLATGLWQIQQPWFKQGARRTHREARSVWMKNLRTGLFQRDQLGWIYSTDFTALPALQLSVLPNGAASVANAVSGQLVAPVSLPSGRDGGVCQLCSGQADLTVLSYERLESALNLSDVIVYDRRGNLGPFGPILATPIVDLYDSAAGLLNPQSTYGWEEVYGPDYPWSWQATSTAIGTNLCTNPSFEYGTTGWSNSDGGAFLNNGAAIAQIGTDNAPSAGTHCLQVTCTNALSNEGTVLASLPGPGGGNWVAGTPYDFSVYIKSVSGAAALDVVFGIGTDVAQAHVTVTGAWARYDISWTPAGNQATAKLCVRTTNAATAVFNIDAAMAIQGSVPIAYFDGDTATYTWSGTPGNSTSVPGYPNDVPVVENGLVRVRYDSATTPGFRLDVWNGSSYVEQGKMIVQRVGDVTGVCNTWVSASLVEYTPERAVILAVLANSGDSYSRERIYITVQRGELGATFECYPALKGLTATPTQADAILQWTPALNSGAADLNQSIAKIDSQGSGTPWVPGAAGNGKYAATAGTGAGAGNSGLFGAPATLGNANFTTSENWVSILRCPTTYNTVGPYQQTLIVLQAANAFLKYAGTSSAAYGTTTDTYQVWSQNNAGYLQCQVQFAATQAGQIMEAEAMTLGTNWSSVADTASSGGNAAKTTQTTDTGALSRATWPGSFLATYRVFVRAKSTVNATVYAKTTTTTGANVTVTGQATPTYSWYDLGEIVADASTLNIHGFLGSAGFLMIDRVEAVLVVDAARTAALRIGSRDAGQAALFDGRMLGAIVAR
jgi:hypothetical protein